MGSVANAAIAALLVPRVLAAERKVADVEKQAGPIGLTGPVGPAGEQGPIGLTGPVGPTGEQGPIGLTGPVGPTGERGPIGLTGPVGPAGEVGARGPVGKAGSDGAKGEKGDTGPAPKHEWQGTKLRFERPDGKWGKLVDLKGESGTDGKTVVVRGGGFSSPTGAGLDSLLPGAPGVEPAGIAVLQGGQWVNMPWSAFIPIIAGAVDMGVELNRLTDFVGEDVIYRGEAMPGTSDENAAVWRIKRIMFLNGDVSEKWAAGAADFNQVWANRASLAYP